MITSEKSQKSAVDAVIQKTFCRSAMTKLIISNEEMDGIMKMVSTPRVLVY